MALPQAPDLVEVPPIATTVLLAPSEAVTATEAVPDARVAKATIDLAAPKAVAPVKPTEMSGKTAPLLQAGASLSLPEATAMAGEDASSEDDPKRDPAPEPTPQPSATTIRSAATEKPEIGAGRADLDRHLVVRQVAERIENLVASRPKDGLVVHLVPRDLGTVILVVKGLQSALDVHVTASDDRVRQSLDASRPELAQALSPRGIELRELRVATAPATTSMGSNAGSGGSANPEGRSRPQTPGSAFDKSSRAVASAPRAPRNRPNGRGVDLLV